MNVCILGFIGKQIIWHHIMTILFVILWRHSMTWQLQCKYIKQPWFEWKSRVDINFNMKDMKMIINISIKILKSQTYRFRFSVPRLCIFNCLMIWKFHCYIKFTKTFHRALSSNFWQPIKWFIRLFLMLRFSEPIKIRAWCVNLVEMHYYGVSKRLQTLNKIILQF